MSKLAATTCTFMENGQTVSGLAILMEAGPIVVYLHTPQGGLGVRRPDACIGLNLSTNMIRVQEN